jgi:hypothetical protein
MYTRKHEIQIPSKSLQGVRADFEASGVSAAKQPKSFPHSGAAFPETSLKAGKAINCPRVT